MFFGRHSKNNAPKKNTNICRKGCRNCATGHPDLHPEPLKSLKNRTREHSSSKGVPREASGYHPEQKKVARTAMFHKQTGKNPPPLMAHESGHSK